jgi:cbb3-type cytochrome oxidase subunit 3
MKLSDVMSHAGLAGYAEIGLVLFLVAFALVVVRVFRRGATEEFRAASRLPLEDGTEPKPGTGVK